MDRELDYSPTEGEALTVAFSLDHTKMFILSCNDHLVSTDHKLLLGILNNRDLASIPHSKIRSLKEKTLGFQFRIQYNPGKWHCDPERFSRNPASPDSIYAIFKDPN